MTQNEFNQLLLVEVCPDEVLATLHSIQCLLMLVERYQNHPETNGYLSLISASIFRLEGQINRSKKICA